MLRWVNKLRRGSLFFLFLFSRYSYAVIAPVSVSGLGNAYSGEAVSVDDASILFLNPAGLPLQKNAQFAAGLLGGYHEYKFDGTATNNTSGGFSQTGTATTSSFGVLPAVFYSTPTFIKDLTFGFGLTSDFDYVSDYQDDSIVRYRGTKTDITTFDFIPGFGYQLSPKLGVGFAVDVVYASTEMDSMIPTGIPTVDPDSKVINAATGLAYGWHGGLLYQLSEKTRIGFAYHSSVHIKAHDISKNIENPGTPVTKEVVSNNFNVSVVVPSYMVLSFSQGVNQWNFMGSFTYNQWSKFDSIYLENISVPLSPGGTVTTTNILNSRDTYGVVLGADYQWNEKLMLRTGAAYVTDSSNDKYRSANIVGATNYTVTTGGRYHWNETLQVDVSYSHTFFKEEPIHFHSVPDDQQGRLNMSADILGIQIVCHV